jgi:hypothetical protein
LNDLTGGGPGIVVVTVVRVVSVFVALKELLIAVKEITATVVVELEVPLLNLATATLYIQKNKIRLFAHFSYIKSHYIKFILLCNFK